MYLRIGESERQDNAQRKSEPLRRVCIGILQFNYWIISWMRFKGLVVRIIGISED